jgi:signal peptidase II
LQAEGRTVTSQVERNHRWLYLVIAGGIVLLDQVSKWFIRHYFELGELFRLFDGDLIWIVYVLNPGMAFGLRIIPPIVLALIAFVAAVGLGIFIFRHPQLTPWHGVPFSLIMGGALGNLIDRLTVGEVIDFISVDFPDLVMPRWPVFNVADSSVSVGITSLIVITLFMGQKLAGHIDETPDMETSHSGSDKDEEG